MTQILANFSASISELKKSFSSSIEDKSSERFNSEESIKVTIDDLP